MGNCLSCRSMAGSEIIGYPEKVDLIIKEQRNAGEKLTLALKRPVISATSTSPVIGKPMQLSYCVIPGQDPRQLYAKECQDALGHFSLDSIAITVLCDGHGKQGKLVADFTVKFMLEYFTTEAQAFRTNASSAIVKMFEECDCDLVKNSEIDSSLSGCTAVAVVMTDQFLHVASVGDSRAVLARVPGAEDSLPEIPAVTPTKFRRRIDPVRLLKPIQLTVDQKPNSDEEVERIRRAGGVVKRLIDENGNSMGPYRVWRPNSRVPGLAMSRSIGDSIGSEIGVISTPIVQRFPVEQTSDMFIVLGSDGIWDVLQNIEVINFIERFRKLSMKDATRSPNATMNSSIARLLCEEARMRWLEMVQERDVMIDDISCLIVELSGLEPCTEKRISSGNKGLSELKA
mmetsp:Transcript_34347/g.60169  ORF Transcript_34347/g.60169 Transcript_34347/m.60169 type:complete len:400 (-) Transcript_34347:150-1349(-)